MKKQLFLTIVLIFGGMITPSAAQGDSNASTLKAEEISKRMIELIKSIKTKKDVSPENIERAMKIKVRFDKQNRQDYGLSGLVEGASRWGFMLSVYPYSGKDDTEADTLNFSFNRLNDDEKSGRDDYEPICTVDFDSYGKELKNAGFVSAPRYGEHGRMLGWDFRRGAVSVQITAYGENAKRPKHQCVSMLTVSVSNLAEPVVEKIEEPPPAPSPLPTPPPRERTHSSSDNLYMNKNQLLATILFSSLGMISACGLTADVADHKNANKNTATTDTAINTRENAQNKIADTAQSKTIEIFDGRDYESKTAAPSASENSLVKEEVRIRAGEDFLIRRLRGLTVEFDEEFSVRDVAAGSFTKPNAKQKAYLYRYSYTNGVVIVEDEKVVAHFSGDPGDYALYFRIESSPDANQNNLSEIVLLRNVEDTEQIYAHLFEFNKGNLEFLGQADFYGSNVEGGGDEIPAEKVERIGYVVSVQPSSNPTFLREQYKKIGSGKWVLTKKAAKFSFDTKIEAKLTNIR